MNNVAPVQNIRVDNERSDLTQHDVILYVLVAMIAAVINYVAVSFWCKRNKESQKKLAREMEELRMLQNELKELRDVVTRP